MSVGFGIAEIGVVAKQARAVPTCLDADGDRLFFENDVTRRPRAEIDRTAAIALRQLATAFEARRKTRETCSGSAFNRFRKAVGGTLGSVL